MAEADWGPGWPHGASGPMVTAVTRSGVRVPVRQEIASLVIGVVNELEQAQGRPMRAGECWGYCNRAIRGSNSPSNHSRGTAIDLDAGSNPMTTDPNAHFTLPPNTGDIAAKWGAEWGGNYSHRKDFMHLEWKISPAEASALATKMAGAAPNPPPPPPPPGPGPAPDLVKLAQAIAEAKQHVVKQGDRGPFVTILQALLANHGYRIAADGVDGPATTAAVTAWQSAKALAADGVVGKMTWATLP